MSRIRTLISTILPSMLAGGLIFGAAFSDASAGRDETFGFWPAVNDATSPVTAKGSSAKPTPPPPARPSPPAPPRHGRHGGPPPGLPGGLQLDGIKSMVLSQLDIARNAIRNQPGIPKDIRDKVLVRLDKARASVEKRMSNAKLDDLEKLGQEMEKMGEEIEQAMEGLEDDLAKLDVDLQQQLGKRLGNLQLDLDLDADDDRSGIPMPPGGLDDDDLKDAMADLKDLALKPAQRDAIRKLRADSDKTVAAAKQQLDDASAKLRAALANPATSDADIARQVDQISAHEASIRKARLVAWNQARRVLDEAQRKRLQDAAQKKTR